MEEYAGSSGDGCPASTCSSWSDDCKRWRQCESHRMVRRELDAARALADLSQMAPGEDRDVGDDERRGSGSKRFEKRPAMEATAAEEERKDAAAVCVSQEIGKSKFTRTSDSIQVASMRAIYHLKDKIFIHGSPEGSTPRKDKDTVWTVVFRKNAFCEELNRKAADLAYDNNNLKKVSRIVKADDEVTKSEVAILTELEATPSEKICANVERLSFMQQQQQLLQPPYSRMPFTPFIWPPHYPVQMQNFPQNTNESKDSMASCMSHQWWIHQQDTICMPRLPFHMMPWPWFCQPAPWHGLFSSDPHTSTEKVGSSADGHSKMGPTSKSAENAEKAYDLAGGSYVETISKRDARRKEEGTQTVGPHSEGMVSAQNPMNTLGSTSTIKWENISQSDLDSKEVVSSGQLQRTGMSNPRRLVDASAAAEARKRRKELTKLKYHQPLQF
ncbi:hypothetical protein ACLOJK_031292 [Asimina triloba]